MILKRVNLDEYALVSNIHCAIEDLISGEDTNIESKPELLKILKIMAAPNDMYSLKDMYENDSEYFYRLFEIVARNVNVDQTTIYKSLDAYKEKTKDINEFANTTKHIIRPILETFPYERENHNLVVFTPEPSHYKTLSENKFIYAKYISNKLMLKNFMFNYINRSDCDNEIVLRLEVTTYDDEQPVLYMNRSKFIFTIDQGAIVRNILRETTGKERKWYEGNISADTGFGYPSIALYNTLIKHGYVCSESRNIVLDILRGLYFNEPESDKAIYDNIENDISKIFGGIHNTIFKTIQNIVLKQDIINKNKEHTLNELYNKMAIHSNLDDSSLLLSSDKFIQLFKKCTDSYEAYIYAINGYITGLTTVLSSFLKELSVEIPKRILSDKKKEDKQIQS